MTSCQHYNRPVELLHGTWSHVFDLPSGGHYLYCHVTVAEPVAA